MLTIKSRISRKTYDKIINVLNEREKTNMFNPPRDLHNVSAHLWVMMDVSRDFVKRLDADGLRKLGLTNAVYTYCLEDMVNMAKKCEGSFIKPSNDEPSKMIRSALKKLFKEEIIKED